MLTDKGFHRPTYDEILSGRIARAKGLFGADVDTSEQSVLGKFIRLGVYDLAQAYEELEGVYYARFPNTAAGESLDRLMPFAGTRRNPAVAAIRRVALTGTPGYAVPSGLLLSGAGGLIFHTVSPLTLDASGRGEALVECDQLGPAGNSGEITQLVNPDADLAGVADLGLATPGSGPESDYDLRVRFQKTVAGAGSATADAISAQVMRVQGVQGCLVVENDGDAADADGRPPHSFECYVLAPPSADYEVAAAIFGKKPLGIKSVGEVAVQVPDAGGLPHTVRFTHTQEIALHLRVTVRVNTFFEGDGTQAIADNLVQHIAGLKNGEGVIRSTLYGDIHRVAGVVETTRLELSTDASAWSEQNISVGARQVARLSPEHVTVEVIRDAG